MIPLLKEIDLQDLPPEERELVIELTKQLYSFIEVRFIVSAEPPWGDCQTDRTRHTRAPVSGKI
jgi:diphthamide synthase subunit DPH2